MVTKTGFRAVVLMDTPVGTHEEYLDDKVYPNEQEAAQAIQEAKNNPLYAGYDFCLEDAWE